MSPMIPVVMRVMAMGAMTLLMMLYFAPSWASTFERPTRPIFAAP